MNNKLYIMKKNKIIFWIATGLLSALLLMSAGMYVFNNAMVVQEFEKLGFPTYIIYPLAGLKLAAVIILTLTKFQTLKEWVYSAILFNLILAFFAHFMIGDGGQGGAAMGLILLSVSYIFSKKI